MNDPFTDLTTAAQNMDWQQVVQNGGPPCFHLDSFGHFCGRSQRWEGHRKDRTYDCDHEFVSLADLLDQAHQLGMEA